MKWKYFDKQTPMSPAYSCLLVVLRPSAGNKMFLVETWINDRGTRVWTACDGRTFNPADIFKWIDVDEIKDSIQGEPDDDEPTKSLSKFFVKKYYRDSRSTTPVFGLEACGYIEAECIKESAFDVLISAIRDGSAVKIQVCEGVAGRMIEHAEIADE